MTARNILLGLTSSVGITLKRRSPCWVTRDRVTGGWINRSFGGALVGDAPRGKTWSGCRASTHEVFLQEYIPRAGDTVVELGAGSGTETVVLSELVGPDGRVIACEAGSRAVELLKATLTANRIKNVEVADVAVAATTGKLRLSERGGGDGIYNTLMSVAEDTERRSGVDLDTVVEVNAVRFDELVGRFGVDRIDLLKVNIEGAERQMIESMGAAIDLVQHAVVSCHDFIADKRRGEEHFRTREEVTAFFREAGFVVHERADHDPARPWLRDYLFISRPGRAAH